jgi:hypothetical protein
MRTVFAAAVLLGSYAVVCAQPPAPPPDRYGVKARPKQYAQTTPKDALVSALAIIDKGDYTYLVAQLMDPAFVDREVEARVRLFDEQVERELIQLRDFQRANPSTITPQNFVPLDPKLFRELVLTKARDRAFKQLVRDVEQKLTDDPLALKDVRKILRADMFSVVDPTASAAHPDIKGRALYFKKVGDRWYLENRVAEEKKEP